MCPAPGVNPSALLPTLLDEMALPCRIPFVSYAENGKTLRQGSSPAVARGEGRCRLQRASGGFGGAKGTLLHLDSVVVTRLCLLN